MSKIAPTDMLDVLADLNDVMFVLDASGNITQACFASDELSAHFVNTVLGENATSATATSPTATSLIGKSWSALIAPDSQEKADALLDAAHSGTPSGRRELNHRSATDDTLPLRYSASGYGDGGAVMIAQDLRPIAKLQQRLMTAQMSLEREFLDLRASDTKYRLLSHLSDSAILIVETASYRLLEANEAAVSLVSVKISDDTTPLLTDAVEPAVATKLLALIDQARANGQQANGDITLGDGQKLAATASLFLQVRQGCAMIILSGEAVQIESSADNELRAMDLVIENNPDAFVIIDQNRQVLTANSAFVELVQVGSKQRAVGSVIDGWFERPTVDYSILMATLREHRVVRRFATLVRGQLGSVENVEISAVLVNDEGGAPLYGLSMRRVNVAVINEGTDRAELPRTTDQITNLVGHMPLKDIVKETAELIEQICIETALKLTGDNRASAAQMLGLSRQSLYAKLGKIEDGDVDGSTPGRTKK